MNPILRRCYVVSICAAIVSQSRADGLADILGAQVGIVEQIHKLASRHEYDNVYEYLDSKYSDIVDRDMFVRQEKAADWTFDIKEIGTVNVFDRVSYFPIVVIVHSHGEDNRVHCVLFFSKVGKQWRLLNFPFLQPNLPEFASIPRWFDGENPNGETKRR